ncbi:ABC transporter permease [Cyclobacteriaceae bacterium YHN15]|nr:ABC transporter permease [Cyclobacteriaceae bacterium YHN15]
MKQLAHLLKFDFLLINKNKIITVSLIVTAIYVGVFKALAAMGNIEKLLVLVIFNDPALLGFLFIGVMVLFEKNENTLEVLAVTPIKTSNYILSKSIALTIISLFCCYAMVIAGYGLDFNFIHFTTGTILTTFIFSMLGFVAVAGQSTFNKYILRALGIILLLSLPFLGYFEMVPKIWFVLFPTQPAIDLYDLSFSTNPSTSEILTAYLLCIIWSIVTFIWAKYAVTKNVFK